VFRAEEIQARLKQQPLQPLRIIASEGLSYDITHPDLVLVGQRDLAIGLPRHPGSTLYDRLIRVALVHIVGMEDLPVAAAPSNGAA
jgi:hypothetical protein